MRGPVPLLEQRRLDKTNHMNSGSKSGMMEKGESSSNLRVYYYYYRKEGHYSSQCLVKTSEKQPAVNMVFAEVRDIQQVTTRAKRKPTEWET